MMNPSSKSILDIILNNQTGVAQQPTLQPPQPLHTNPGNALSHHQQHLSPQPYLYAPQHVAQFAGGAQNAFDTLDLELQSFVPPPQHQNIQRIVHQRTRSNSPVKVMKQQKTVKLHPIQIAQQQLQNHCSPSGCSSPTQTPLIDPNINPNQTLFVDTQALSKRKINFACTECRKAHKGCNGERPCQRCKKLGIEDKCKSTVRKKNRILANKYWKSIMSASANSPCSHSGTPTSELDFPGGHEMLHQGIDQMSEGNLLKQAAALVHQHFQSPSVAIPSASGTSSNNSSPDVSPRHQRVPSKSANTPPSHYMKQSPPQAGGYFFDSQQMNFANSAQPAAAVPPPAPAAVPQGGNPQEMYNKLYNDYFHYFYNSIRNEQLKNPNAASPTVRSPPLQPFANTPAAAPNVNNLAANISNMNIGNGTPKQQPSPPLSAKNSVKQETNLRDSVDNGEHNRQTSGDMFSFLSAQAPLDNQSSDNPFWLGRDADMNVDLLRRESQDSNFLRRESMDLPNAQFDDDNLETFFSQPPSSGTNTRTDEFDEFAILDNSMRQ